MKTTGYEVAQRLDTHPICLWGCLPAFALGTTSFSTNTEKEKLTKIEVPAANGSISTHLVLIWGISAL